VINGELIVRKAQARIACVWLVLVTCCLLFIPYDCSVTYSDSLRVVSFGNTVRYGFVLSDPPAHRPVPLREKIWGLAIEAPIGVSFTRLAFELLAVTLACAAVLLYVTFLRDTGSRREDRPWQPRLETAAADSRLESKPPAKSDDG